MAWGMLKNWCTRDPMKRSVALVWLLLTLGTGAAQAHFPASDLRLPAKVELVVTYQPRPAVEQGDSQAERPALPAQTAKAARETKRSASLGGPQAP